MTPARMKSSEAMVTAMGHVEAALVLVGRRDRLDDFDEKMLAELSRALVSSQEATRLLDAADDDEDSVRRPDPLVLELRDAERVIGIIDALLDHHLRPAGRS